MAGFALINSRSHRNGSIEHTEFFVVQKHRRYGVATEAVGQILAQYPGPGHWEIAVTERNVAARAFWPRAIGTAPNISQLAELGRDGELSH